MMMSQTSGKVGFYVYKGQECTKQEEAFVKGPRQHGRPMSLMEVALPLLQERDHDFIVLRVDEEAEYNLHFTTVKKETREHYEKCLKDWNWGSTPLDPFTVDAVISGGANVFLSLPPNSSRVCLAKARSDNFIWVPESEKNTPTGILISCLGKYLHSNKEVNQYPPGFVPVAIPDSIKPTKLVSEY